MTMPATQPLIDDALARSPYPKHKGQTLDEIASTSEGLVYLDWLIGWLGEQGIKSDFRNSLSRYLARPEISRAVDEAIETRSASRGDVPGAWHPPGANRPWWEKARR
jgi:hypothetical protein